MAKAGDKRRRRWDERRAGQAQRAPIAVLALGGSTSFADTMAQIMRAKAEAKT